MYQRLLHSTTFMDCWICDKWSRIMIQIHSYLTHTVGKSIFITGQDISVLITEKEFKFCMDVLLEADLMYGFCNKSFRKDETLTSWTLFSTYLSSKLDSPLTKKLNCYKIHTLKRCSAANLTWVWISDSGADCNFWGKVTIFGNSARWFPFTVFMDFKYWQFMDWWMYLLSRQEGSLDIYPSFQRFPQMAEQHL